MPYKAFAVITASLLRFVCLLNRVADSLADCSVDTINRIVQLIVRNFNVPDLPSALLADEAIMICEMICLPNFSGLFRNSGFWIQFISRKQFSPLKFAKFELQTLNCRLVLVKHNKFDEVMAK